MKKVFLDQCHWITLARAFHGKEKDPVINEICENVVKKSDSSEVIFPLSLNHFMETIRRNDVESRLRLAEFMVKVSRGYSLIPYCIITPYEVEQAINKQMGWPTTNLNDFAIRNGFHHLMGSEPKIVGEEVDENTPFKIEKDFIEHVSDFLPPSYKDKLKDNAGKYITLGDFLKEYFNSPDCFLLFCEKLYENEQEKYIDYDLVKKIEAIRMENKERFKDKNFRYRAVLAISMSERLVPLMVEYFEKLGQPPELLRNNRLETNLDEFIKDVPTFYVDFQLTYQRDIDFNKPVNVNDLVDITSLAIAIPYCDIVVFERRFGSFARSKKLDEIYNTTIITNIKELNDYL